VSLAVAPGEILGLAGVEGNGQTELIDAITGLRPVVSGSIRMTARRGFGRAWTDGRSEGTGDFIDITHDPVLVRSSAGLSHIPEDRHRRGLILDYSIADNLILGQQHRFSTGARLDARRIAENAAARIREFDIRPADPALPARALSGGNQQKIVIAREMGRDFTVLIAAQPTRGVDVGAIEFIHDQLRRARDAGKAILLLSADLIEVLALADRVAVMYGGRIVAELPRAEASPETLGPYMTGAVAESAA
jgi:simple sugar transport system ATP-binding protein